jgi:hypothetical protein
MRMAAGTYEENEQEENQNRGETIQNENEVEAMIE